MYGVLPTLLRNVAQLMNYAADDKNNKRQCNYTQHVKFIHCYVSTYLPLLPISLLFLLPLHSRLSQSVQQQGRFDNGPSPLRAALKYYHESLNRHILESAPSWGPNDPLGFSRELCPRVWEAAQRGSRLSFSGPHRCPHPRQRYLSSF